jgi:adenosylcobyric acid synthase
MLGERLQDEVESKLGALRGLELLPVQTEFRAQKTLARPHRTLSDGSVIGGYEIHHGAVKRMGGDPMFADEGCREGSVDGTIWHGLFENDGFRRDYLVRIAARVGKNFVPDPTMNFAAVREKRLDVLADLVADNLDLTMLRGILNGSGAAVLPALKLGRE